MTRSVTQQVEAYALIVLMLGAIGLGIAQDKPEWQKQMDAAASDTGVPDCPEYYSTPELRSCLELGRATGNRSGNRQCLMAMAVKLAKSPDLSAQGMAYTDVMLAQCRNADAQAAIASEDFESVIGYLRTLDR